MELHLVLTDLKITSTFADDTESFVNFATSANLHSFQAE